MLRAWIASVLIGSVFAGATGPEPPTPSEAIGAEMITLRDWIRNAQVKFQAGGVGLGDAGANVGPAQRCCALNLTRLDESTRRLGTRLDEIDACYEGAHDAQGRANLAFVRSDLESVRTALAGFAAAGDGREAGGALASLGRGYLRLAESMGQLAPCASAPAAKGKGKRNGRKSKADGETRPSPAPD